MTSEKEKIAQQAVGTRERQVLVTADYKDTNGLIDGFIEACENFGLFVYEHPECEDSDMHGFVVSEQELTQKQLIILYP